MRGGWLCHHGVEPLSRGDVTFRGSICLVGVDSLVSDFFDG